MTPKEKILEAVTRTLDANPDAQRCGVVTMSSIEYADLLERNNIEHIGGNHFWNGKVVVQTDALLAGLHAGVKDTKK